MNLKLGRPAEAQAAFDRSCDRWKGLIRSHPSDPNPLCGLPRAQRGLALSAEQAGDLDGARLRLEDGIRYLDQNRRIHADNRYLDDLLRDYLVDLDRVLTKLGRTDEAIAARRRLNEPPLALPGR